MKRFLLKLCTVCAATALVVSAAAVPTMAAEFLSTYSSVPNNYEGDEGYDEGFWFDCEEFIDVTHRSAFRGEPYVSYLRDYSTPKHTSGDDGLGPYWGVDEDADNRYMIINPGSYWTQDNCIEDAYTFTIDVALGKAQTRLEDGSFDGIEIPNVADKFAGVRMYTVTLDNTDALDTSVSSLTPGKSGLGFNFNVADDSKDELIIYALNSDKSVAQAAFALENGTFDAWTTFKVTDQLEGELEVYVDGKLTAKVSIDGSNVAIMDASGAEKASTSNANISDAANFHVVNANDGDILVDNVGVKYFEDSDAEDSEVDKAPVGDNSGSSNSGSSNSGSSNSGSSNSGSSNSGSSNSGSSNSGSSNSGSSNSGSSNSGSSNNKPTVDNSANDTGDSAVVFVAAIAVVMLGAIIVIRKKKA